MRIALLSDLHFGVRQDSSHLITYQKKFFDKVFFPYVKKHNITECIILGDVVDRRKYINFKTLQELKQNIMFKMWREGISTHILLGNHDIGFKNSSKVNAIEELFATYDGKADPWIYTSPKDVDFGGTTIGIVPWINQENHDEILEYLSNTKAQIIMGHFEIEGFQVMRGIKQPTGLDKRVFDKFDIVFSGHFHHKHDDGHIFYLGVPYELTWSDFEDDKGFHVFDTDTRELEFIRNPYRLFHKIIYDDKKNDYSKYSLSPAGLEKYNGCFVKVIVVEKNDYYMFDKFLDALYANNPYDVSIIEDASDVLDIDDDATIDLGEDTITVLNNHIDSMELSVDKDELKQLLHTLYVEANNLGE